MSAHQITTWRDNKPGALSITFDDGYISQFSLALPALNSRGLKATFFVITNSVGTAGYPTWANWSLAASMGHEIGSHSKSHTDLTNPAVVLQDELQGSKTAIDAQITSQKCLTLAYPYGDKNQQVETAAQNIYIAGRGIDYGANYLPIPDLYNVAGFLSIGPMSLDDMEWQTYLTEQKNENKENWMVAIFHNINDGTDEWAINTFEQYLDYVKTKNLWVGTFGSVVKYISERASASLSVVSSTASQIVLSLTDALSDSIYNEPLTLRSEVPSGWGTWISVQQGSNRANVRSGTEGSIRVVYYNAIPDQGPITLKPGFSLFPPRNLRIIS